MYLKSHLKERVGDGDRTGTMPRVSSVANARCRLGVGTSCLTLVSLESKWRPLQQ